MQRSYIKSRQRGSISSEELKPSEAKSTAPSGTLCGTVVLNHCAGSEAY
jgi:hypothetical protein